ncbi:MULTISPECIES: amino acid ABC transporter permease [Desulfococcus]|jgi:polar amino acid transport system permease protein|uniref:Polar amino acid ABC transporter, inner membrane subunit n=1 Tax=Desulfococcus multivorans DSM 2059 TaxID=1121405 RepID=S7TXK7_DESML|nr:amino acid ABC transporter permease [Desulfococcus multivorans]AOY57087.1 GlnP4: glutamine ABC transporter, permease protein [Desulfococcus multivorans]AQU99597.1 amino acid ABC transporter permease [Desulfococcus multivorans]EPR41796.1 polar amino acid ABC transporter, inner membrane subunit [Desulfococcus multivorans DSM 2059]MDX9818843.1 amino acid ABC transporter permease [Desulfococcus multivorans]SJZ87850.1 amino acid ABC transporter membrane protein 2, PAAT family (TC 3.A.1.3.-) [Des
MWTFYFERLIVSLPSFLNGIWVTVQISGLSLIGGTLMGLVTGILRTRDVKVLRGLITIYVDVVRGTPYLIQIFIFFFILPEWGLPLEAFGAAVASLTLYAGAHICEIVAGGIESVPRGQWEAARASGFNWLQQMRLVILPQALGSILPPLVGQYVLLIKNSSIVSVIGLMDVTRVGWLTVQRVPEGLMVFGLVGILYFCVCYPLIQLSRWFERRLTIRDTTL